jgi:hypothetical protein
MCIGEARALRGKTVYSRSLHVFRAIALKIPEAKIVGIYEDHVWTLLFSRRLRLDEKAPAVSATA